RHKNDGVTDSKFGVHDLSFRARHAHDFSGSKDIFVVIDSAGSVFAGQPWRNGMILLGDGTDSFWHGGLLIVLDVRAPKTGGSNSTARKGVNTPVQHSFNNRQDKRYASRPGHRPQQTLRTKADGSCGEIFAYD
ncbi:MAG: hypothetical protein DMG49_23770, partial [Acidobacteria bacterium]